MAKYTYSTGKPTSNADDVAFLRIYNGIDDMGKLLKGELKHRKLSTTPIDVMDKYYRLWKKKERKGKYVKTRHVHIRDDSTPEGRCLINFHRDLAVWSTLPSSDAVYSYKKGVSPRDCALPHVGCFALFKLDIKDFFPSITRTIIEDMYHEFYDDIFHAPPSFPFLEPTVAKVRKMARHTAILCTRSDSYGKVTDDAVLPIGIEPASVISNAVLYEFDEYMKTRPDLTYTRFSDNLFISSPNGHIPRSVQDEIIDRIHEFEIAGVKPFRINSSKRRYSPYWRHQRVLSMVINEKVNIPKVSESWLRSALNHLYYDAEDLIAQVQTITTEQEFERFVESFNALYRKYERVMGMVSYTAGVNRAKYGKYVSQTTAIRILIDQLKTIALTMGDDETLIGNATGRIAS